MDSTDPREVIRELQAQMEEQAQIIRQQQETQQKLAEEIALLKEKRSEMSEDNSHNDDHNGRPPPARSPTLLPFTNAVMQAQMLDRFPPQIERFDGTIDPEHHLRNFVDSMAFYSISDPVKCRAFSLSLKGEAL